ncbi:MAG: gliding motility-associated C-terminal domain-containing protein [Bacteroidetes bacterium]|nr:gliding motility-associated C-terminal domain-containing protein [Bacteroidota bacterium]
MIAGSYAVTITDAHLCTASSSISITQPLNAVNATTSNTPSICGLSDGGATVSPTGGTMPYSYSWLPTGGTGTTATGLAPGTYTITVSDANNCSIPVTTTITSTGNIVASITTSPIICYGQANGSAMASVAGGSGPYTYLWSSGATTNSITNIASGAYCVTIIDLNGCRDTACVDLYDPPAINADFTSNTSVTTIYDPEIFFYDQTAGSTTWQWDFGDASGSSASNPIHNFGGEGTFPVTLFVSNSQGCTDTVTHYITINDGYTFYAPNAFTPDNNGENDIFLPKGTGWDISRFDMMIFDRWGNVVFHSTDVRSGWNGSLNNDHETAQADVYVWKVQVYDNTGLKHNYLGAVTMVK